MLLSLGSWGYFCPFSLPLGLWAPKQDKRGGGEVLGQVLVLGGSWVSLIRGQTPFGDKGWVSSISKQQGFTE